MLDMSDKNLTFALQFKNMASKYPTYSTINSLSFSSDSLRDQLLYISSEIDNISRVVDFVRLRFDMNHLESLDAMIYDANHNMKQKMSLNRIYEFLFTILNGNDVTIKLSDLEYVGYFDTSDVVDPLLVGV